MLGNPQQWFHQDHILTLFHVVPRIIDVFQPMMPYAVSFHYIYSRRDSHYCLTWTPMTMCVPENLQAGYLGNRSTGSIIRAPIAIAAAVATLIPTIIEAPVFIGAITWSSLWVADLLHFLLTVRPYGFG